MPLFRVLAVVLALAASPGIAAPVASPTTEHAQTPKPAPKPETVYITKTGKKYHQDGCRSLAKSKIEISLPEAKKQGFTACAVCHRTKG